MISKSILKDVLFGAIVAVSSCYGLRYCEAYTAPTPVLVYERADSIRELLNSLNSISHDMDSIDILVGQDVEKAEELHNTFSKRY